MKPEQTEVRCDTLRPALENGLQLRDVVIDDAKYISIISSPATSNYGRQFSCGDSTRIPGGLE
jgi:hypothetical protein